MKGDKYLHLLDSLQSKNRLLGVSLMVLVGINAVNLIALARVSSQTQTVIVPIGSEGMQIGNGRADEKYIRRMTRYIVNQIGSYSAGSARQQYQELQQLFSPAQAPAVAAYFDKLVVDIERYPSISSSVEWVGEEPLKYTSNLIQVLASKQRLVNGGVTESKQVHYCIHYHIEDARFFIDSLDETDEAVTDACLIHDQQKKTDETKAAQQ